MKIGIKGSGLRVLLRAVLFCLVAGFFSQNVFGQRNRLIHDIQGDKNFSPYLREIVRVSGIVTARTRNGFFIQTPDDKTDDNPNTSQGIFVFTGTEPGGEAALGNLVSLTGQVDEFVPRADPNSLSITQIRMQKGRDFISVESKGNPLPKPIVLTIDDFKPNAIDQLEKYEGMRVTVPELMVVAPTGGNTDETQDISESNGVFYGVLKGVARPYREPGFSLYELLMMPPKEREKLKKEFPKISVYDHNPERLRIESKAQLGSQALDVTVFSEIKNLTGVMNYAFRAYSILVDAGNTPTVTNPIRAVPMPVPNERQISIAAMNIERLFDDEDDPNVKEPIITSPGLDKRFRKLSAAIRLYLHYPDVIGIIEAENLAVLQRLADRINKDAEASGKPNPKYEAFLVEGNDPGGIDSGFLVKRSRLEVLETRQFGKEELFKHPNTKKDVFLNDRPPFLLRAGVKDEKTGRLFDFTVIVNHLKSFRGYDDAEDAPFVRLKKRLQAEFLAKYVNELQKNNPNERIALVGDFNFYQFNDGIMDVIGTIKGTPAPKEAVMIPSEDLLNPDLINLVDLIKPEQRYSYVFDGNAQVLDHFIINEAFRKHINGFGFARLNADFPEIYRNDANRVERFSDHDIAVAFFSIEEAKP